MVYHFVFRKSGKYNEPLSGRDDQEKIPRRVQEMITLSKEAKNMKKKRRKRRKLEMEEGWHSSFMISESVMHIIAIMFLLKSDSIDF